MQVDRQDPAGDKTKLVRQGVPVRTPFCLHLNITSKCRTSCQLKADSIQFSSIT